jgi:hypothetical protein
MRSFSFPPGCAEARISVYSVSLGQPNLGTFLYQDFLKGVKTPAKMNLPNLA